MPPFYRQLKSFRCIRSFYLNESRKFGVETTPIEKDEVFWRRMRNPRDVHDRDFDFHLAKTKGQHLLMNSKILQKIISTSDVQPNDTVLEIGPGTGNLTLHLLEAAGKVIAVEIDKRMLKVLHDRVTTRGFQDKLSVICEDALRTKFPPFDLVVANIPYRISSPLIIKLVHGLIPFRSATLLLQKEFARRLLANCGEPQYNRLAVNVKIVANVELVMDVSKREFFPSPDVDSSVVIIRPKTEIPNLSLAEWRAFTRALFGNKNKTLGANFKQKRKVLQLFSLSEGGGFRKSDERIEFDESGVDVEANLFKEKILQTLRDHSFENKRPSKMCIDDLMALLSLFNQAGIHFS